MANDRLAVIGASGFVGSALCERLWFEGNRDFTPFIHGSGSAARLARLPLTFKTVDVLDPQQTREALAGHSVVVNCSRGDDRLMIQGLKNLIDAAKRNGVRKLIHLSSIAIYGDDPPSESQSESCPVARKASGYGLVKKKQDEMVLELRRSGIASYAFCPSNISGPYSPFSLGLARALERGVIGLVEDGSNACNLVHVDNLVEAMLTAVRVDKGAGERYFVNELRPVSWKQYFDDMMGLTGLKCEFVPVSRDEIVADLTPRKVPSGIGDHLRIAVSGEFRNGLSMLPVFGRLNSLASKTFNRLPIRFQQTVRGRVEGPVFIPHEKPRRPFSIDEPWIRAQIRRPFHSPEKAVRELGFQPVLSYPGGLETIAQWMESVGVGRS
ncbi:MAG: NAD-dependent epimerase/dehydratase family protein [Acidobacteria bacterium]|nr:NAD-dependent epimerase/dehydratase family protein [Acidobacteriota bacterium]